MNEKFAEQVKERKNEVEAKLLQEHNRVIDGLILTYFDVKVGWSKGATLPLQVFLRFRHESLTGYFETEAKHGAAEAIFEWLDGLGLLDGTVGIHIDSEKELLAG